MRLRRLLASRGRGWLRTRQLEIERRSLTHDTVEPNGPSHRMHQLLGDAQPQPGPVEPSRSRRIRMRELHKSPRPELLGNPSPASPCLLPPFLSSLLPFLPLSLPSPPPLPSSPARPFRLRFLAL